MISLASMMVGAALALLNPTPSPDGTRLAYTSGGDLYVMTLPDSTSTRITFDGTSLISNGRASWVYYEEIFGRQSEYRAFWWSPDSKKIAFYRFDESSVPEFPIYSPFGQGGKLKLTRYPKAGQSNPEVRVGIADLDGPDGILWPSLSADADGYLGTPFWSADSRELYVQSMPHRRQNVLDIKAVCAADGSMRDVYHEEYSTWIDWIEGMVFTKDGLYMARCFETGWQQIYFLGFDGSLKRITDGPNWDIQLIGADAKHGRVWFTAKRDSRIHPALYVVDARGKVSALTSPDFFVKDARISADCRTFTARISNARVPWVEVSGRADGKTAPAGIDPAPVEDSPFPEIVMTENDGYDLYGLMSLPRGFDPTRKYPVVMQLYGGPGTPYVRDWWQNRDSQDRWCWENGIIYIVVDPRSSGENGRKGMDEAFRRMTVRELDDYIAWAEWLAGHDFVDASRIGVEGFSFGGTTTAMLVLRYPELFRCGIAGGGVYDWTLYDSHYTERFMCTPEENPEGYAEASVLHYVKEGLISDGYRPGSLKLTHGTGDDNVHFQNTLQLVDALQQKGVQFGLMIYPDGMHGYRGLQKAHNQEDEHRFWTEWLL